ncbi:MAG: hypothetical protein ACFB9M_06055 [Myxococcota bacterium]
MRKAVVGASGLFVLLAADVIRWSFLPSRTEADTLLRTEQVQSPGRRALEVASLNHGEAAADALFLRAVQYVGRGATTSDESVQAAGSLADLITDLAPRYYQVYFLAATVLTAYAEDADASDHLLVKGQRTLPDRWPLVALQAYNALFLRHDPIAASRLYAQAAALPGAPMYLASLAGRATSFGAGTAEAMSFVEELIENLPDGPQRENARERLRLLRREQFLEAYDEACSRFLLEKGRLPDSAETLNELGFIDAAVEDAYGEPVVFEVFDATEDRRGTCVSRTAAVARRDFEVLLEIKGQIEPEETFEVQIHD